MSHCPQCGAATTPGMSFCVACGRTLAAAPGASATPAGAPVGRVVEPWKVVAFTLASFGIYAFFAWWRTSREVDAYAGSRSHGLVRAGVLVTLLAGALVVVIGVMGALEAAAGAMEDPDAPIDEAAFEAELVGNPLFWVAAAGSLAGAALLYGGMWRAWSAIRRDEERRGRRDLLRPGLFVGVLLAGVLLSYAGFAYAPLAYASWLSLGFTVWILATWQAHLNDAWRDATQAPAAW